MCQSCEVLNINGQNCHETGCPDAWKDYSRECFQCGFDFKPDSRHDSICQDCQSEYDDYHDYHHPFD